MRERIQNMRYGINFGAPSVVGMYKESIKLPSMKRGEYAQLVGACDTQAELDSMLIQANNGSRKIHVTKHSNGFALYCYWV